MTQSVTYIGIKVVNAKSMNRKEYNDFRGWVVPENENPNDDGYLVEYTDSKVQPELEGKANGYVSWSLKDVFERTYAVAGNDNKFFYAMNDNGSIYIGDGDTLEQAKHNAEAIKNTVVLEDNFDFGTALHLLQAGQKVARSGWNGKGMYLFIVKGDSVKQAIHDCYGDPNKDGLGVNDAIYMYTASKELVPWLASQTDVLANDWVLVE